MSLIWAESLLRTSLQGGLAILIVFAIGRAFPKIPSRIQVWLWRAAALKLILGMIVPVTIFVQMMDGTAGQSRDQLPTWILALSLVSFALALLSIGIDWRKIALLNKGGKVIELPYVSKMCVQLGIRRAPVVLVRNDIDRPMLIGVRRPTIHLPSQLDLEAREMVLAHELAHMKRKDLAWEWLFIGVDSIFAFHPLVWLMRREHRMAQESACDSLAIETAGTSITHYGRMLLELTIAHNRQELAMTANMAGTYTALRKRILRLQRGTKQMGRLATLTLVAASLSMLPTWRAELQTWVPDGFKPHSTAVPFEDEQRFGEGPIIGAPTKTPKEGRP